MLYIEAMSYISYVIYASYGKCADTCRFPMGKCGVTSGFGLFPAIFRSRVYAFLLASDWLASDWLASLCSFCLRIQASNLLVSSLAICLEV